MALINLAEYQYSLSLDDRNFTSGMTNADAKTGLFKGNMAGLSSFMSTVVVGALVAVGIAAVGMAVKGVKSADEMKQALNGLQASTGATSEEIQGMEQSLENIYNNNYGEDFKDIADSMALVKQVTGLTGDELEHTTQNAIMLRDTFEFDVNESINSANSMMKQFGISSEEAFTLIAQGAQNGANKNGDLIDTLNEYSPQFKALGFSAEEFTDVLIQGAQEGAFSIDKIGDSIKEFNIRSKDMSDTSADAFNSLGFNANDMFSKFAEGGDTANQAFQEVIQQLAELEDPLEQNRIGVELFGTQFEDLGAGAITSLANIQSQTNMTADTLNQINNVKYDSFGEALAGIGRNLETGILIPLGEAILPILNEFASWLMEHMPEIQEGFRSTFEAIGIIIDGLKPFIQGLIDFITQFKDNNSETLDNIRDKFSGLFEAVGRFIQAFVDWGQEIWAKYGDEITAVTQAAFDLITSIISTATTLITDIINIFSALLSGNWSALWEGIKQLVFDIFEGVKNILSSALDLITSRIDLFGSILSDNWSKIFTGISDFLSGIWDGMVNIVQDNVNSIISIINGMIEKVTSSVNKVTELINNIPGVDIPEMDTPQIPQLDVGTNFVPHDMLAYIHKGEAVVPKAYNPYSDNKNTVGGGFNQTVNIYSPTALSASEIAKKTKQASRQLALGWGV